MTQGLFITGTSTEVGKTYITAQLAAQLVAAGKKVGVYKPVASSCVITDGEIVAEDAVRLWEAAGRPLTLEQVCPQKFMAPLAPHVAARMEGKRVDAALLRRGIDPWLEACDFVLVEGAGGMMSPLADEDYNADLAADLGFPVVVVAANRLGVINDTLQTVITAHVWDERIEVAGVVLNQANRPDPRDVSLVSNGGELRGHLKVPLLAETSWQGQLKLKMADLGLGIAE